MNHHLQTLLTAIFLMGAVWSHGQSANQGPLSFFQFLQKADSSALPVTITSNFQMLIKNKLKEEYQPARMSFVGEQGDSLHFDMKIKTRGNSRKAICFYPPIKINLKKSELKENALIPEFDKYKLVTQCRAGKLYEEYLIKEYLAYKVLEQVYPYSFKVHLLKIVFRDVRNNGKIKESQQLGFIIESEEEMAERLDAKMVNRSKSGFHHLERKVALEMALCQYMIGNTDWAMPNLHNMKILKGPAYEKVVPVPYDFDYSGLVDSDYAVVHESLSIKDVRTRLYLGPSCTEGEVRALINVMRAKKDQVLDCIFNCEYLDEREQGRVIKYLEAFFEELENESRMIRVLGY